MCFEAVQDYERALVPPQLFFTLVLFGAGVCVRTKNKQFHAWVRRGTYDTPLLCAVTELRSNGATIQAPDLALPNQFTLLLTPDGSVTRRCKVISRRRFTVVVEFIG